MKRIFMLCLSLGLVISLLPGVHIKNNARADGVVEQNDQYNDQYIVSYVEYSLYNQNGNLIKSVKQGKILITPEDNAAYNPKDYNILEKDYQTDNISSEEINEYKIQPLKNIINEIQKPVQKRPRPIMPIMDAQNT